WVVRRRRGEVEGVYVSAGHAREVRVADVNGHPGELDPGDFGGGLAEDLGWPHVHRHPATTVRGDEARSRAGADHQLARFREPRLHQVVDEHPHAVAAHLGHRTVGVAVVHEPQVCRNVGGRVLERTGADDPQDTI